MHRVGGVRDSDGVTDALLQQRSQGDDRANASGLFGAGMGDAKVQRIIKPLAISVYASTVNMVSILLELLMAKSWKSLAWKISRYLPA